MIFAKMAASVLITVLPAFVVCSVPQSWERSLSASREGEEEQQETIKSLGGLNEAKEGLIFLYWDEKFISPYLWELADVPRIPFMKYWF